MKLTLEFSEEWLIKPNPSVGFKVPGEGMDISVSMQ